MYINHIFFIHSSVDGHLGFFHILAIVISAAVNMGMLILTSVFFGYIPGSGIAGSYSSPSFYFSEELSYCFPQLLDHFVVSPLVCKGSNFFCSLTTCVQGFRQHYLLFFFLINSHSNRCDVIGHCGSDLHFPND